MVFLGIIFGLAIGIFLHELAHYFAARLLGLEVAKVRFGCGPLLASWTTTKNKTVIECRFIPLGGFVRARPKQFLGNAESIFFAAAGPLANLFVYLISFSMRAKNVLVAETFLSEPYSEFLDATSFAQGICIVQLFLLFITLFPKKHKMEGGRVASDGLQILTAVYRILMRRKSEGETLLQTSLKQYVAPQATAQTLPINLATTYLNFLWDQQKSLQTLVHDPELWITENRSNLADSHAAELMIIDLAATKLLTLVEPDEAGKWRNALSTILNRIEEIGNDVPAMEQTRVGMLVELGRFKEAFAMQDFTLIEHKSSYVSCLNYIFRARAEGHLGMVSEARKKAERAREIVQSDLATKELSVLLKRMELELAAL